MSSSFKNFHHNLWLNKFIVLVVLNTKVQFETSLNNVTSRWLSTRLEITGHCVIFLSALISVLQAKSMDAAQAGLAISSAMGVSEVIGFVFTFEK